MILPLVLSYYLLLGMIRIRNPVLYPLSYEGDVLGIIESFLFLKVALNGVLSPLCPHIIEKATFTNSNSATLSTQ